MNNKGQALIEFVLILPVFIMILFLVIDFGNIYSKKANLENDTNDIVSLLKNGKDFNEIKEIYKNYMINISYIDDYEKVTVVNYVDLITPGLSKIISSPYEVKIERYIYYE